MRKDEVKPVERTRPPETGPEREMLTGLLDFLRATAASKVAGLTDEQGFSAPAPPSALTPAGLIKHLTGVERFWFSIDFAGADVPWPWPDENPHGNFPIEDGDTLAGNVRGYLAECARSRAVTEDAALDDPARGPDMHFTLLYALAHLIEETSRHCGHLDILRGRIDGSRGE